MNDPRLKFQDAGTNSFGDWAPVIQSWFDAPNPREPVRVTLCAREYRLSVPIVLCRGDILAGATA